MNQLLDAILRRITIFIGATFGTFIAYIAVSELYGVAMETPTPDVLTVTVARIVGRVVVSLTAGHAVALAALAFSRRGHSVPALVRSAVSGIACATVLEAAHLWSPLTAAAVQYRVVQIGAAVVVSILICAVRMPRGVKGLRPVLADPR